MPINDLNMVAIRLLTERANDFFTRIIARLNSGNYPKGESRNVNSTTSIQEALSITPVKKIGTVYIIDIIGNLSKAPFIWAFEYGSGIHGDNASTYPITPNVKDYLVFYWERAGRWVKFKHVNHPGIAAKPYIKPTVDEHIANFRSTMIEKYRTEIRAGLIGTPKEYRVEIKL